MKTYSQKLIQESRESFESVFGRALTDEEICQVLHDISSAIRIVCGGGRK